MEIKLTHIDTACCLLEIGEYRILTDPVFDDPGRFYHHGYGAISKKVSKPAITHENIGNVDLILLSHPQHKDNFDTRGRELAKNVPMIISTRKITKNYSNSIGLVPWESHQIDTGKISLKITATPARHHPKWLPEFFSGKVIGFVIEIDDLKKKIYITGDTIFYDGIKEVAKRFPDIWLSMIHVGGVQFRYLTGFGLYTMNRNGFVETMQSIDPDIAIPIHNYGWTHFKENDEGVKQKLESYSDINGKVKFIVSGETNTFQI